MGILFDACSIILGCLAGSMFKKKIQIKNMSVFGIAVIIIGIAGFFENVFNVSKMNLKSDNIVIIAFSLIIGSIVGDALHIDDKLSSVANFKSSSFNALADAVLFFGIGGLQISGSVLLALNNDSSQLIMKGMVDFPFAIMFGIAYGKITSLSAVPVALTQAIIMIAAMLCSSLINKSIVCQICALGYIVLFFTGFNLLSDKNSKINNINMLPSMLVIILLNLVLELWRKII